MAATDTVTSDVTRVPDGRRPILERGWLVAVFGLVLLLVLGWRFLADPSLSAPTRDPAWYTWRAQVVMEGDPGAAMIDTILCDIRMPRASGLEAITYFRKHYPSVPVVVLTGYPDLELAASLMKQGVLDYLTKPVTREELLAVIERCVDQHGLFPNASIA